MDEQERNEHFKGFAELLYDELGTLDTMAIQRGGDYTSFDRDAKRLIAQRAYDLVLHTVWNIAPIDLERLLMKEVAAKIPDLTEWPKTPSTTSAPDE